MNNRDTACFDNCARDACIIARLVDLNAEAVQLAATIRKNFEELGV